MKIKGQMEIFGLAIVVVLLMLGMMFMLYFITPKQSERSVNVYVDDQMAQNLISAMLKVTTSCNSQEMYKLIQDCAMMGNFESGGGSIDCGSDDYEKLSCDYVKESLDTIFTNTLKEWKRDYYFKIYKENSEPMYETGVKCPLDKIPGLGYVPLHPGTLVLQLDICQ